MLQNAFPTLERYIEHVHTIDGKPARVPKALEKIILENFKNIMKLKERGINLFFTNIDNIKKIIFEKLK